MNPQGHLISENINSQNLVDILDLIPFLFLSQLFDHIAQCLADFMKEQDVHTEKLPLGFTFSFPLRQVGLTKGLLERWTKGFNCSGVVGLDVVQLLKDALARRNVCIDYIVF